MNKDYKDQHKQYPLPGDKFKHYKGGVYKVITMSTHTETDEKLVIYKSLNFGSIYARPWEIFSDKVDKIFRFTKID